MRTIVVTGAAGSVGQRVLPRLGPEVADRVVAIDVRPSQLRAPNIDVVVADVATAELTKLFAGADTVIHLAWSLVPPRDGDRSHINVDGTRRVLAAAAAGGARMIVHRSSAAVYGAWPDNPVPMTEEAAVRPNPGAVDPIHHAEAERMVNEWAIDHPGAHVAVLRPTTMLGPGVDTWLTRVMGGQPRLRPDRTDPPRQFVHPDDVASAAWLAVERGLDGVFNVAADGWVAGNVVRELSARRLTLPVPSRLAGAAARWAWGLHLSDVPPALLPFLEHPWIVANDRLRSAGWEPLHTNEEVVVAGRPAGRWREMSPSRRQEVALGSAAAGLAGAAAIAGGLVHRARRRRTAE